MVISIIGCGWFGLSLGRSLVQEGHQVKGATTTAEKIPLLASEGIEPFLIRISPGEEKLGDLSFFQCDVLVITIPPKVHLHPGTDYLFTLNRLIELAREYNIRKIIFISSTSVYGDVCGPVDEDTLPAPETLSGQILVQAEKRFTSADSFQTTVIRFGGLVGPGRDPGRFFAGKENSANGLAPVNLIHLDDCIGIVKEVIRKDFFGHTLNACSPHHPTRKDFYTHASLQAGMKAPQFINELTAWKVVNSKYIPGILYTDFEFRKWF